MIPIPFGTSRRALLGLYDPPAASSTGNRAVLICNPWGAVYFWSYGTLRSLARRYADAGTHAMRFDYFGCGESGGDMTEGSLSGYVDDTLMAIDELQAVSAAHTIHVAGAGLGALIASRAAAESTAVTQLLLWDPIAEGRDFLAGLSPVAELTGPPLPEGWPDANDSETLELFGGPVTPAFAREVRGERIDPSSWRSVRSVLLVTTLRSATNYTALLQRLEESNANVRVSECPWPNTNTNLTGALPVDALDALVDAVS